jgi:hypothetical protein
MYFARTAVKAGRALWTSNRPGAAEFFHLLDDRPGHAIGLDVLGDQGRGVLVTRRVGGPLGGAPEGLAAVQDPLADDPGLDRLVGRAPELGAGADPALHRARIGGRVQDFVALAGRQLDHLPGVFQDAAVHHRDRHQVAAGPVRAALQGPIDHLAARAAQDAGVRLEHGAQLARA